MREHGHGDVERPRSRRENPLKKRRIGDTNITIDEVYLALTLHGLNDQEVLQRHPELKPEDIPAVREFISTEIHSRDRDGITGRPILPKGSLVDGMYYKGRCGNATVARWDASENCFYHWREKFGYIYIETIRYPTDEVEPWWDVFNPVEQLQPQRFEVPFDKSAEFHGNPEDLREFDNEMWYGWKSRFKKC